MNNKLLYILVGILIGALGVYALTANVNTIGTPTPRSNQMSDNLDAHFIEQMIPHHEDAITMATLAQKRTRRPEVKKLADDIITAQSAEIDQMKDWYENWFGRDLPTGDQVMQHHGMGSSTGMHMGIRGDESDITRLTEAEDFDRAFVEHMIPHHQMAVMMATMLKNGTRRPEMSKLADDIITSQSSEIELMREWLVEWNNQ